MESLVNTISIFFVGTARYFLVTLPAFYIIYVWQKDYFKNSKIQSREAKRKDFLFEIGNSIVSNLAITLLAGLVLFTPLIHYTQFYYHDASYPAWWPFVAAILALIVHDTYFYWMHRAVHHPMLYKKVHLTHHKSINPSPFASYSFHVWEALAEGLILPIVLLLIPMNPFAIYMFVLGGFIINVYGHLGHEIAPKWFRYSFLFQILNTSTHHNLHHSKFIGNYGLYTRIWDRLMKTENPDYVAYYDQIQEKRFGQNVSSLSNTILAKWVDKLLSV